MNARKPGQPPANIAWWIALLLLLVYLLTYAGVLHSVDEQATLAVTETLLQGQGFHANQMAWDQARTPPQNAPGRDGQLYSKKGIGVSLAALPLLWAGKQIDGAGAVNLALLTGPLAAVLTAWAFFWLGRTLDYPLRVAAAGALTLGLATPLWPYTRTLFSEGMAAAGLTLALWGAVAYRRQALRGAHRTRWLWLAGVGLGVLLLMRSANVVMAPVFALYLAWGWAGARRGGATWRSLLAPLLAFALPVAAAVVATMAYNFVRFGTLLSFPQAPFERFSTPLAVGLAGLLLSPGKGLLWYMPLLWLVPPFVPRWPAERRLPDFLLALGAALAPLLLFALWYDWPGGRAWGPRMVVLAVPALTMLALPALDWLLAQRRLTWRATLVAGVLLMSFLVQLPGVLVNFERQEELDMQAGATFDQLLWDVAHTPLLTYWSRIATTPDPTWLQPYVAALPPWLPLLVAVAVAGASAALFWAALALRRGQPATARLAAAAGALALLAVLLVAAAGPDPRWDEASAVREENAALLALVAEQAQPQDLVLLDLLPATDKARRTGLWLNRAGTQPYIGWLRTDAAEMAGDDGAQLRQWLAPYRRVWLLLQATDEGDPASTTERWLDTWAFPGRRAWVGSQRYVEYILPPARAEAAATTGPFTFGRSQESAQLAAYRVSREPDSPFAAVTLQWAVPPSADLRYSVQALDATGALVAQVDGIPGRLEADEGVDRVGIAAPGGAYTLILKLYRAADGEALALIDAATQEELPYLHLVQPGG